MADFPYQLAAAGNRGLLTTYGDTPLGDIFMFDEVGFENTAAVWTANRAMYQPICVRRTATVTDAICRVQTQAGNLDMGLYSWTGTRLVSSGSTAVAAAGVQVVGLADTTLTPGWYFGAFACDSSTAVFRNTSASVLKTRAGGCLEQASAFALPATATFAAVTLAVTPLIAFGFRSVL